MTLIVGILCKDGVVMASDSAATYGDLSARQTIGQQQVTKVRRLGNAYCLFASSGAVGISQLVGNAVEQAFLAGQLSSGGEVKTAADSMQRIGMLAAEKVRPYFQNAQLGTSFMGQGAGMTAICSSLVGYYFKDEPCLVQIAPTGAPEAASPELPFVTLGCGQNIGDPFIAFAKRVLWSDRQPTLAEGRFAAAWTVWHAIKTNPGGIGPPLQMATLTKNTAGIQIEFSEFDQHQGAIDGVEAAMRDYFAPPSATPSPIPTPEST